MRNGHFDPTTPRRSTPTIRGGLALGCFLASALWIGDASAQNGVTVMSVGDYGPGDQLAGSIPNGNNFMSRITRNGTFSFSQNLTDDDVESAFFLDPQRTGNRAHIDNQGFDTRDTVISYFTGHGDASTGAVNPLLGEPCTASPQCTNPGPAGRLPGVCVFGANQASGRCGYRASRSLFTFSNANPGGRLGQVQYDNFQVAFGESVVATRGPFAGTDGGTNLVVLDISFGTLFPFKFEELPPAMAGVHLVATIMPVDGDTASTANRGPTFADSFTVNPNGAVSDAWLDVINSITDGSPCADGGFGGINGCGANFIIANGVSANDAENRVTRETWLQVADNNRDSNGDFLHARWLCNYDCVTRFPPLHD
jgi:hypothetical protein